MEILQTKIYNKTDNFNLEKGQSYPDLKSTLIIHQKDVKNGKIYVTDYNGYCIEIFDVELNQKMEDLIRDFDAYKLSVNQLFNETKVELKQDSKDKDDALKQSLTEKITENKTSIENLKKKLPKDLKIEGNKLKLILNDDTVLGDITITVSGQNTKIKEFKYDAGVFKIIDTEDNVFPSGTDLTQLFAPKNHNHDTEYVKVDDSRITTQYLPLSWNKRNNKEVIKTQSDDWLRINDIGSHPNGVYFGESIVRTDGVFQVGAHGSVFFTNYENNTASIILGSKVRIRTRQDDDHIAFGDTSWTKLIYGEFAGIKIWNHNSNEKVVLAGGGVKYLSDFDGAKYLQKTNTVIDAHNWPELHAGVLKISEGNQINNLPFKGSWYHILGIRHANPNNNYRNILAFPFERDANAFYYKAMPNHTNNSWVKFIGFQQSGNTDMYHNIINNRFNFHFTDNGDNLGFGVYSGQIGSATQKFMVQNDKVKSSVPIEVNRINLWGEGNNLLGWNGGVDLISRQNMLQLGTLNIIKFRKIDTTGWKNDLIEMNVDDGTLRVNGVKSNTNVSGEYLFATNGSIMHLPSFIGTWGQISGTWGITTAWYGRHINVIGNTTINLSSMTQNQTITFRKCYAGGEVQFVTTGKQVVYTSGNRFNGGDGSTAFISTSANKMYIDIKNV